MWRHFNFSTCFSSHLLNIFCSRPNLATSRQGQHFRRVTLHCLNFNKWRDMSPLMQNAVSSSPQGETPFKTNVRCLRPHTKFICTKFDPPWEKKKSVIGLECSSNNDHRWDPPKVNFYLSDIAVTFGKVGTSRASDGSCVVFNKSSHPSGAIACPSWGN